MHNDRWNKPTETAVFTPFAKSLRSASFCVMLSVAWLVPAPHADAQSYQFNTVQIDGNERIGDSAILSRAGIARGRAISAGELNDAYQNLQASGLFESVALEPRGGTLVITVVEFPTINRISFEGNARIDDEALASVVDSDERRVFNPTQAEKDANAIAQAYSNDGRIAARVQPKVIRRDQNRVDLVFEVFEGDNVEIERLSFVGNREYSDRRLRRVLGTKQAGLFRRLIKRDTFVPERIEADQQMLRDFYLSRGYVDMRISAANAQLTEERDGYFVQFNVQEGQQFKFGELTVTSTINGVNADDYRGVIKTKSGAVYSPSLVETDIARMERKAIRDGVDFLRVEPVVTRNDRDLTLNVEYRISRGPRVFVERIDIEGNTTTLDRVVRRQFDSVEGDPFNPREIRESAERIRALGYFESAEVNAREGSSPEQVVVDVNVVEQPTGSLNFGGSFSSSDGIGVAVSFAEDNFLGRGQKLKLTVSTAEDAQRYGFNFIEPSLLGRDVAFGLNLDYAETSSSYNSFDTERIVFQPTLSFPVSENGRLSLNYTYDDLEMSERDDTTTGFVVANDIAAGRQVTSSIGYNYSYDTRRAAAEAEQAEGQCCIESCQGRADATAHEQRRADAGRAAQAEPARGRAGAAQARQEARHKGRRPGRRALARRRRVLPGARPRRQRRWHDCSRLCGRRPAERRHDQRSAAQANARRGGPEGRGARRENARRGGPGLRPRGGPRSRQPHDQHDHGQEGPRGAHGRRRLDQGGEGAREF